MKAWLHRIGSRAALEERQAARLAYEINAPVPGPRGLSALVKEMHRRGIVPPKRAPYLRLLKAA